ncbi:MAG TPA: helix-hairpin-helix domain-containing protein [Usitatibacter sp.]|nr:helix-hairpin-helix domain-containing protein [Usitatibacter sp.]
MKKLHALIVASLAAAGIAFGVAPAAFAADPPKAEAKKAEPMDINSASEKDLATLPGIGEARAKAIVKGRPYKGKDDLVHRKILTEKVYDGIKDQIIAKQK